MKAKPIPQHQTLKKNAGVIETLQGLRKAAYEGRLDQIISLKHWEYKEGFTRPMTMSEIDKAIEFSRSQAVKHIEFAMKTVRLFSLHMRRNYNLSCRDYGYTADMILANISEEEFDTLAYRIQGRIKDAEEGKILWYDKPKCATPTQEAYLRLQQEANERLDAQ